MTPWHPRVLPEPDRRCSAAPVPAHFFRGRLRAAVAKMIVKKPLTQCAVGYSQPVDAQYFHQLNQDRQSAWPYLRTPFRQSWQGQISNLVELENLFYQLLYHAPATNRWTR